MNQIIKLGILTNPVEIGRLENYLRDIYHKLPVTQTGTAAPTSTPGQVGDRFIDTNNKKFYIAMGIANNADWVVMN